MKIDAHHHFWNPRVRDYYWMGDELTAIRRPFGPADLRPLLASNAIDGTIIVQTIPDVSETEEFLDIAGQTDFVRGVVGWVDLTSDRVADVLGALLTRPNGHYLKGIRHQAHDEDDTGWLARSDVIDGIAACGARGLVQDLLPKEPELPACIACIDALPEVQFVIDHIAKPRIAKGAMQPWLDLMRDIAKRPNVVCKLSGMVTEADWNTWTVSDLRAYSDLVFQLFGPDRVLFGSDWPVCLLAGDYQSVVDAARDLTRDLTPTQKDAVFGENARRVYRLA